MHCVSAENNKNMHSNSAEIAIFATDNDKTDNYGISDSEF